MKNEEVDLNDLPEYQLIDIREKEEREAAHIGGEWIPMGELEFNLDKLSKDMPIVLYCRSGQRSLFATRALRGLLQREDIFSLKEVLPLSNRKELAIQKKKWSNKVF